MMTNVVISGLVIVLVAPAVLAQMSVMSSSFSLTIRILDLVLLILALAALLLAHEILHLILIPGFAGSSKTCLGITYAGPFVATEEVLTKQRFMVISIFPYIALSILLPLIAGLAGMLTPLLIAVVLLNALGASVDMLSLLLVLTQVPAGARIVCNGMSTYWKAPQIAGNS